MRTRFMDFIRIISVGLLGLGLPVWVFADPEFSIGGTHRLRYESLHHGPRPGAPASDELLVSRLLAHAQLTSGPLQGYAELQDSRSWLAGTDTPLGTDDVNALEPLQAWLGWKPATSATTEIRVGRMTKEWRTRRLVARNRFRNTLNSFRGIDVFYSAEKWRLNTFALEPLNRRPTTIADVSSNSRQLDRGSSALRLYGVELRSTTDLDWAVYALRLDEADSANQPSRNRQLWTVGAEWRSSQEPQGWHHAGEVAMQFGTSRASNQITDITDLSHRAWMAHIDLGYQWEGPRQHQVRALLDVASGDDSPTDGSNQRFDTLFGARRFEYGPSGIFGVQARSNVVSPSLRWTAEPASGLTTLVGWRGFWLHDTDDAQAGTGIRNPLLATARHVGQQLETRVRFQASEAVGLEVGLAYLKKGTVLTSNVLNQSNDTVYAYLQTTLSW